MGQRRCKALVAFSDCNEIKETLVALAAERLTQKQKAILHYLSLNAGQTNVTNLAQLLSTHLNCALSTVWNSLRALKSAKIISYGSKDSKGLPVSILPHAQIISEKISKGDEK